MPTKSTKKSRSALAQLALTISDLSAALTLLVKRPAKDIQGAMRHEGKQIGKRYKRKRSSVWRLPLTLGVSLLSVLAKILLAPLELWAAIFQKKKFSRTLLFVLVPSCCLLLGCAGYAWFGFQNQKEIGALRSQAAAAIEQNDFAEALGYFEQLEVAEVTLTPKEKFLWAQALVQTNELDRANELLHELAPSRGPQTGYPLAHQFAAVSLVRTHKQPYPAEVKRLLKWHLDAGGVSESPDVSFAKAQYCFDVGQLQSAIEAMEIAATAKPELNLNLALLYKRSGQREQEQAALLVAQEKFEIRLQADSADHQARIALAQIYLRQRNSERAEQNLLAGVELAPEVFRPQLAAFLLQKFRSLPVTASVEMKIDTLINAWRFDWQNVAVCESIIGLYRQQEEAARESVLSVIERVAAEQPTAALPHFALGVVYRLENRLADSEASIKVAHQRLNPDQPGFTAVANNLAWLLAHAQHPDLEQAFELAEMAVKRNPHEGGLRDTLATVLMKQGHYQQALTEFQKALPTVRDKSLVHLKMAEIYDQLDQPQLAALHRSRSQPD